MKQAKKKIIKGWVLKYRDEYNGTFDLREDIPNFYMSRSDCADHGKDWKRVRATLILHG